MNIPGLSKTLFVILSVLAVNQPQAETAPQILAPGYGALAFPAPEPGSYTLPVLDFAADGNVLDTQGKALAQPFSL
jgi:hypothetical protein